MTRRSIADDLIKQAAMMELERAFDNAKSMAARSALLQTVVTAANVDATRRRSQRIQAAKDNEEPEQEGTEEEGPEQEETEVEEESEDQEPEEDPAPRSSPPLPLGPRQARVKKLKQLLFPDVKVGGKRKRRAFNEVRWEEIQDAYNVKYESLEFKPSLVKLPPENYRKLSDQVGSFLGTSTKDAMTWAEDDIKELSRIIFRNAGDSIKKSKIQIASEVSMTNLELNVTGRADMVISNNGQQLVVVECKRACNDYSKGTAQMMLAAEMLLAKKLKKNNSPSTCIYGLLVGSVAWTWLYLNSTEGRFYRTTIDAQHVKSSIEGMAEIALGLMSGQPIAKNSQSRSNPGNRVKRV